MITESGQTNEPVVTHFERVAEKVADKIAELFATEVLVTDQDGSVVASSNGYLEELDAEPPSENGTEPHPDNLHVPFCCGGYSGELIIKDPCRQELISPRLAKVLVELVINQATTIERLPSQRELKNKFLSDLLHDRIEDDALILQQAETLGLDLTPPRAVILIDAAEYILSSDISDWPEATNAQAQRRAQFIINSVVSYFQLPSDLICAYIGEGEVAVLKASDTQNLASWADDNGTEHTSSSWANLTALKRAADGLLDRLPGSNSAAINLGIGRYHPGIRGLARSYRDARVALALGRRFRDCNRVHCLDELGIASFVGVADEQMKIDLAVHLLSPLDHEPELLQTLNTFFAVDRSPSMAANELYIHRNTLSYRLDKIASLTGLDPRQFDDAVQIRLALLLRSLRGESGSSNGNGAKSSG